jgi:Domain of unknown function (DUF4395)
VTTEPGFPRVLDDVTVRLVASEVLILAVAALALHQWWIYAVLAVDFILQTTLGPRASPLAQRPTIRCPRVSARKRPTAGVTKRLPQESAPH